MNKTEQNNLKNVKVKESYQGTNPLERAYQGKQNQAAQTPKPPQVGSTTSVPATNSKPKNTSQEKE